MIATITAGLLATVAFAPVAAAGAFTAAVTTGGPNLTVREGPTHDAKLLREFANGSSIGINCYVQRTGRQWSVDHQQCLGFGGRRWVRCRCVAGDTF
jgi:uncharacterized protein YraI